MTRECLVLLPGMMCDERLFGPQLSAFGDRFDMLIGDLTASDTITGLASAVLARIQAERFNLAGLSMGGIVAMEMVKQAGSRVQRLALMDTNHYADSPERRVIRDAQIVKVRGGRLREVIVAEMKPSYLARANRANRALLDLLVAMAMDLGEDVFIRQTLALRNRSSYESALASFNGLTLILYGAEDKLCPPERHREMASLVKQGTLVAVAQAGHITTLENSSAVNAALNNWLNKPVEMA